MAVIVWIELPLLLNAQPTTAILGTATVIAIPFPVYIGGIGVDILILVDGGSGSGVTNTWSR